MCMNCMLFFLQRHKLCIVFKCITEVKVTCKMAQIYMFIDGADRNVSLVRNKSESDFINGMIVLYNHVGRPLTKYNIGGELRSMLIRSRQ